MYYKPRRRRPTKIVYADQDYICAGCKMSIPRGQRVTIAIGHAVYHPVCRRLHVRPGDDSKQRFLVGSPVGKRCGGCDDVIHEDESVCHIMAVPYHKECRP